MHCVTVHTAYYVGMKFLIWRGALHINVACVNYMQLLKAWTKFFFLKLYSQGFFQGGAGGSICPPLEFGLPPLEFGLPPLGVFYSESLLVY